MGTINQKAMMKTYLLLYRRGDGSENYRNVYSWSQTEAEIEASEWCELREFERVELIEI